MLLSQCFGTVFPLFRWGQKGKTQIKGHDDATEQPAVVEGVPCRGVGVEGCERPFQPKLFYKKAQCALVNTPSSLHVLEKGQNSFHGQKP